MPTFGNPFAGSLAAALAAIEVRALLCDRAASAAGHEIFCDARSHAYAVTRLVRNRGCRFSHESWGLESTPDLTLREAFDLAGAAAADAWIVVPDHRFVSRLECDACGHEEEPWRIQASLGARTLACPRCAAARAIRGIDLEERVSRDRIPAALLARPLSERGLRAGDVVGVGADAVVRHFVVEDPAHAPCDLIVAGLGNIGSFLAPLAARLPGVARILLCDPDAYEPGQPLGQDARQADAGRNKAEAQADRIRALRPDLAVEALAAPIESLPSGRLRGAIAVGCLDSLGARQRLAARAWRAGIPFVDAAVGGGESLIVRTNVYVPGPDAACFECAFDAGDYERVERTFACGAAHA